MMRKLRRDAEEEVEVEARTWKRMALLTTMKLKMKVMTASQQMTPDVPPQAMNRAKEGDALQ